MPARPGPGARPAIRAVDDAFVRGYNKADAKGLTALFTEDAEVVQDSGESYQGRDAVEKSLAETFAASKGARLTLDIGSIRLVSPDVASEEGRRSSRCPRGCRCRGCTRSCSSSATAAG